MHKRHVFILFIPLCHGYREYDLGMHLDIESLRVLLTVLDTGGMTRAAEQLHMGQSAVSRKVSRLEERVGQSLLIRDGHTLRPTRAARALLPDAREMVEIHDRAAARLTSTELEGSVTLSSNGEIEIDQIASMLGAFKRRHPGADVEFSLDSTGSLTDLVDAGELDVALFQTTDEHLRPTDIVLWSERLLFVTSASDQHRRSFTETPIPILDFGECCYYNEFTHAALSQAGIVHKTVFSAATSHSVRAAVVAGFGVAAMSERYLGPDVVEWKPPFDIAPLPTINQVIRTVPGESSQVVDALVETIKSALCGPRPAAIAS